MNILDIAIAKKLAGGGGGSGTDNYNDLSNLPKINDTTLSGNKSSSALGLQSEINSDSKLASDLVDDTNQDNKFVTSTEKNTWNAKQNAIDADHKINADYVDDSTSTNKFVTASDKETWNAKQNAIDNSHKLSSDLVDDANHTNKFVTSTEKQTWNAKQNAIDSDHKLSSSLVSFTTAEAAALASGIDSTKVAQISTNQSNILYVSNKTGKNLLKLDSFSSPSGITYTVNADNSITINKPAAISNNEWRPIGTVTLKAGTYVLSGVGATGLDASRFKLSDDHGWNQWNDTYTQAVKTVTEETTITIYINILAATTLNNVTIYPMVCTQEDWNIGHDYAMYALPNYDLTRLEAEDRASLADVVDSGAKNLINCSIDNLKSLNSSSLYSWNGNTVTAYGRTATVNADGTITVAAGTGSAEFWLKVANYTYASGVSYVLSGCPTGGSTTTYYIESDNLKLRDIGSGVVINSATTDALYVVVKTTASTTALTFKPMLCTKAAFGVSNKFVPYRPNYDLVVSKLNNVGVTKTIIPFTASAAGTYELITATKITLPAEKVLRITAGAIFQGTYATGIKLIRGTSIENSKTLAISESTNDYNALSTSSIYRASSNQDIYVALKCNAASTVNIVLAYDIL